MNFDNLDKEEVKQIAELAYRRSIKDENFIVVPIVKKKNTGVVEEEEQKEEVK